jgi:hypothetical protein
MGLLVYDTMHSKVITTLAEEDPSLQSVTLCSLVIVTSVLEVLMASIFMV